jgi:hypothetical protein
MKSTIAALTPFWRSRRVRWQQPEEVAAPDQASIRANPVQIALI